MPGQVERRVDEGSGPRALIHFVCMNPDHVGAGGVGYSTVHAAVWAWCPSGEVVEDHQWSATETPLEIADARRAIRTANLRGKVPDPSQGSGGRSVAGPADATVPRQGQTPTTNAAPAASGRDERANVKPKRKR
jgi:hypothetical protein